MEKIYYDPETGFISLNKFIKKVKEQLSNIKTKDIVEFYNNQEINQINKKVSVTKDKFYKINAPDLTFQIDLMFINKSYKTNNIKKERAKKEGLIPTNDFYVFLLCVDILSRKAFIFSLKDKTNESIMEGYKKFLQQLKYDVAQYDGTENYFDNDTPFGIVTDSQFDFKQFNDLNEELNIIIDAETAYNDHISKGNRLGIIDRLVRTLKNIFTKFVFSNNDKFSTRKIIEQIVSNYNNTIHSSLDNFSPNQIFASRNARQFIFETNSNYNSNLKQDVNYQVGDTVRILEKKSQFDKEKPQFSKELYTIANTDGFRIKVAGINRRFKLFELQKVDPETIEKQNEFDKKEIIKQNHKQNTITKTLKREDIDEANILVEKRIRKPKQIFDL